MQDNVAADMDLRQVISLLLKGTLQLFNTHSGERARAAAQANSIPTSASFATLGKAIRNSRYRLGVRRLPDTKDALPASWIRAVDGPLDRRRRLRHLQQQRRARHPRHRRPRPRQRQAELICAPAPREAPIEQTTRSTPSTPPRGPHVDDAPLLAIGAGCSPFARGNDVTCPSASTRL